MRDDLRSEEDILKYADPYIDPETGMLKNRVNAKSDEELANQEANLSFKRIIELKEKPIKGNYDLKHLQKIHKQIFQDVYPWAGEVRTVNISKGIPFCNTMFIEQQAAEMHKKLQKDNFLKGLPPEQFAEKAARYFATLNNIHPFREGNGRTQLLHIHRKRLLIRKKPKSAKK